MKHHLHFQPIAYTVRVYEVGKTYENGDPYAGVLTAQMTGRGAAHITGLHGAMTRAIWREITDQLGARGVKTITYDTTNGGPKRVVATNGGLRR